MAARRLSSGRGTQKLGGSPLSAALGGISAAKMSSPEKSMWWGGAHLLTNGQDNDQWLLQTHFGARAFLDREHNMSLGITRGYLYNFGPSGMGNWTSTTADLTIRFQSNPLKAMARGIRRATRMSRKNCSPNVKTLGKHHPNEGEGILTALPEELLVGKTGLSPTAKPLSFPALVEV